MLLYLSPYSLHSRCFYLHYKSRRLNCHYTIFSLNETNWFFKIIMLLYFFLLKGTGLGTACHVMSSRLTRLFINFTVFTPTTEVLMGMYGRNIQHWLEEFPTYSVDHHFELSRVRGIVQRLKVKVT